MDISILFEDDALLIINKPPGVVVNRAQSVKVSTLQDWVEQYLHLEAPASLASLSRSRPASGGSWKLEARNKSENPIVPNAEGYISDPEEDFRMRAGMVHRIDKETSGCLVIAKTVEAFIEVQRQFKERLVQKTYLAIAHGKIVPEEGEISAPVGRLPWNRERFGILPGGKESVTRYKVRSSGIIVNGKIKTEICLVELYPKTGRTHQIRVHLAYIHHPIVADFVYAGRKTSRADRLWAPRTMLHAWKINFIHPTPSVAAGLTDGRLAIEAPIPDDMNRIIRESANTTNLQMD